MQHLSLIGLLIFIYLSRINPYKLPENGLRYKSKTADGPEKTLKYNPFEMKDCYKGKYPPHVRPGEAVPTYKINLDLPPELRWQELGKAKGKQIVNLLAHFKSFLEQFGTIAGVTIDVIDKYLEPLADSFPAPFGDEIKGLAKAAGMNTGEAILYNIFYEVFTVCTSLVAQDEHGKMYHARNLDFGLFMGWNASTHQWIITDALRPMIVNLEFTRHGATLFRSVNFAGYVGILTAVKPKAFTLTMDERFNVDGGYVGIFEWLFGHRHDMWMGFLTRNTMEHATSYKQAKAMLSDTKMLAPAYFILGGTDGSNEACVITRSRDKTLDTWELNPSNGTWYLVETNYDRWQAPPFYDNRRQPAIECMNKKTKQGMSLSVLFDVLSSRPMLNKLTAYTALMRVDTGHLETYLQHCPDPCTPW